MNEKYKKIHDLHRELKEVKRDIENQVVSILKDAGYPNAKIDPLVSSSHKIFVVIDLEDK